VETIQAELLWALLFAISESTDTTFQDVLFMVRQALSTNVLLGCDTSGCGSYSRIRSSASLALLLTV
jgi:hypothetical protein